MIAIVTDRPNVGREIARVLGAGRKENGYMTGNGYMVTWTYGNMLSLAMPKDSGTAHVEWKDFPLLPPSFLTVRHVKTDTGWNPDINAVLQLKVIAKVLNACDTIIAATDASREGEMLFRHLYGFLGCKQPCLRLWISSLTDEAITEGMANLLPCDRFDNLFLAADSRNRADWLLGVNSSYAICKAVGFGNNSLGRVQTPVLAEICRRYRERENHMPADSWPVFISLCKNDRILKMRHVDDLVVRREALALYEDCKAAKKCPHHSGRETDGGNWGTGTLQPGRTAERCEPLPQPDGHTGAGDCTKPVREEADFLSAHLQSPVAKGCI